MGADLRGMGWGGWTGWLANPFWRSKTNKQKIKMECECFSRNKGEFSGQVPDCNLYFVASLVFLVKQFYIRLQFSNCNILGTCPIDSATRRCQRTLSPLKKPEYAPCIIEVILRSSLLESREGINLIIIYYNYLLSDLLRERTKWIKFCAVIGWILVSFFFSLFMDLDSISVALFPFRKQAMPFLTLDAIIGNQAFKNGRCHICFSSGLDKVVTGYNLLMK